MKFCLTLLVLWSAFSLVPVVRAQDPSRPKPKGLSPQDQRRFDELMKSGDRSMSQGMWLTLICSCVCSFMLAYGAWKTFRDGLRVNKDRVLKGAASQTIAVVLLLASVALPVVTWFYLEGMRF